MLMAMRINVLQHWKKDTLPTISDWEQTQRICSKGKINSIYSLQSLTTFKQELLLYMLYVMQQGKLKLLEYGL